MAWFVLLCCAEKNNWLSCKCGQCLWHSQRMRLHAIFSRVFFSMPMAAADYDGSTRAPKFSTIGSTQHGLAPRWSRRSIRLGPIRTRPTIRLLKPSTFLRTGAAATGTASDWKNHLRGKKHWLDLGCYRRTWLDTSAAPRTAATATCARRHRSRAVQPRCAKIKLHQLELTDHDALRQLLTCQFQLSQSHCPAIISCFGDQFY